MSICAFDVGIKNLAFCVMQKEDKLIKVKQWELVNIFVSKHNCIGKLRGGGICGKPAKIMCKRNPQLIYCKSHQKQYVPLECQVDETAEKQCCYESASHKTCKKKNTQMLENKVYCHTHLEQMKKAFERNNKLTKIQGTSCMHASLFELGRIMYTTLDKYPEILQVEKVVIENQPTLKNPTMKSIEMILFSYFVHHNFSNVKFVSPSGKLRINEDLTKKVLANCKKDDKYDVTKELSIQYCKYIINNLSTSKDELLTKLEEAPKQDDICDAFLHAYYHMIGDYGLSSPTFANETLAYFDKMISNKQQRKNKKIIDEKNTIKL